MNAYGYTLTSLCDLNEINHVINKKMFYKYKNVYFLFNFNKINDNLVIFFNGMVDHVSKNQNNGIVLRGYNYDFINTNTLCICDSLTIEYKNNNISWYLSTEKHDFASVYKELLDFIVNKMKLYNKIIFTGSSGGGYPSIYYSALFNGIALVGNAQVYPEYFEQFPNLHNELEKNDDKLKYTNNKIENVLVQCQPEKVIMYQNMDDLLMKSRPLAYCDGDNFTAFIKKYKLNDMIQINLFESDTKNDKNIIQHFVPFSIKHKEMIQNLLK